MDQRRFGSSDVDPGLRGALLHMDRVRGRGGGFSFCSKQFHFLVRELLWLLLDAEWLIVGAHNVYYVKLSNVEEATGNLSAQRDLGNQCVKK